MTAAASPTRARTRNMLVTALCAALILSDGYDLIVYGNIVPALLHEPGWGLTASQAGHIASLALAGMAVGALLAGTLADRIGRRKVIIASLVVFSASMAICALAQDPTLFEIFRLIGGFGLGAMFPTATALLVEFAPTGRQAVTYSLAFFGYLIGGIAAGGLGLLLLEDHGWRILFWIGAAPVLLVPVLLLFLPESLSWLSSQGRTDQARATAARYGVQITEVPTPGTAEPQTTVANPLTTLFSRHYRLATVLLWATQFCSLLLVFGMVTWLPTIMTKLDYSLGFALAFVLTLNIGAGIGALAASRAADRIGAKPMVVVLFLLGALSVAALAAKPPSALTFSLIAIAGAGTLGTQILANLLTASLYPAAGRATGLGWALAIGRIGGIVGPTVGGWIIDSGLGAQWNFYLFAAVAAAGAILALILPLTPIARKAALPSTAASQPTRSVTS